MDNLVLKNISKSFGQNKTKVNVIKNINLNIKKGESVALVGPSGAGKTTMLQIAGLLANPDQGQIFINNIDASKANDNIRSDLRKNHIGFVYQFHHLLPEFSALENIAMPLFIRGVKKADALKEAKTILQNIGLESHINYFPSQLSGGQQQRIAVARAIIGKPNILLADEPTGNLDSENSEKIFDLIANYCKEYGISSLIVTHNTQLSKKMDRIIEIKDGILCK